MPDETKHELLERIAILEAALRSMISVLDCLDVYNHYQIIREYARSVLNVRVTDL
jgi:hypothetical protein